MNDNEGSLAIESGRCMGRTLIPWLHTPITAAQALAPNEVTSKMAAPVSGIFRLHFRTTGGRGDMSSIFISSH